MAALTGAASNERRNQRPARPRRSICVLPFANMSGEAEQDYFSDGISEDIITDLSQGVVAVGDRPQHRLPV